LHYTYDGGGQPETDVKCVNGQTARIGSLDGNNGVPKFGVQALARGPGLPRGRGPSI
jgi:hypothetical protein